MPISDDLSISLESSSPDFLEVINIELEPAPLSNRGLDDDCEAEELLNPLPPDGPARGLLEVLEFVAMEYSG